MNRSTTVEQMKDINDILAKYFSGEANPEEVNVVQEWKIQNADEFTVLEDAWKTADNNLLKNRTFKTFDAKTAWNKIDSQLNDPLDKETKIIKLRFYKNVAAACALFLIGLTGFWFFNKGGNFESVSNMANLPKEISLPDGSTVWLASNTTLEFNADFEKDRNLRLNGEAFFEVARDEMHPFVISTDYGSIEVLGTAFNVNTTNNSTNVAVDHGKVEVRNENGKVQITAGESAVATTGEVKQTGIPSVNYNAWKTGEFVFENTPLNEVVSLLNKHYNTRVVLDDSAKNKTHTGIYKNEKIDVIINSIVLTCDVEAEKADDVIRLR